MYEENICNHIEKTKANYRSMSPEIVMTSSFYFQDFDEFAKASSNEFDAFVYTRGSNPTTKLLEDTLAKLEHGERCKVFASGMGAISATLLTLLKANDHVLIVNTVYGASVSLLKFLNRYHVQCDVVHISKIEDLLSNIKENTRVIYFESPSSQQFQMIDLKSLSDIAKEKNILTIMDNTWASPLYQHPLDYGIDIVVHSCSKYVGGHSDIVCGAVISTQKIIRDIEEHGFLYMGATCSPMNAYLALRGIRTLPIRMKQVHENIKKVLDVLQKDHRIAKIYHPYCYDTTQKKIADTYLNGYGSLFAIDMKDEDLEKLKIFINNLKVFTLGVSWGGFESLVLPVYKGNNARAVLDRGLNLTHIRIYVGLENTDTLIQDIMQALDKAYGK